DLNDEKTYAEIITQDKVDPRMRVRPNPAEIERAAKLLVEAKMPLMIVGDEVYGAKAVSKAVDLAELLGMPVTQVRQIYASFPESHPLWVGGPPAARIASLDFPKNPDVVINVGNKLQHNSPQPIVAREAKFIDMRNDSGSMGNVMNTEVPLVADVAYGLDDLKAAVEGIMTSATYRKARERAQEVGRFSEKAKALRALVAKNPEWSRSPMLADRVTWEVAQFADKDAIIVHEAGSVVLHGFDFNPLGGRELFFYYGAHLGSGVGTAAGVKLARPNRSGPPSRARTRRRWRAGPISSTRRWRAWESPGRRSRGSRRSASRGSARRKSRSPHRDAESRRHRNAVPDRRALHRGAEKEPVHAVLPADRAGRIGESGLQAPGNLRALSRRGGQAA